MRTNGDASQQKEHFFPETFGLKYTANTAFDGVNLSLYGVPIITHICDLYLSLRKRVIQHNQSWLHML